MSKRATKAPASRKRATKKKTSLPKNLKSKVDKIVDKKLVNKEDPCYSGTLATWSISSTPVIQYNCMNLPCDYDPLPAEHNTKRTCNKVQWLYIRLKGTLNVADSSNRVRILLLKAKEFDTQNNPLTATQIFNDKAQLGGNYVDMQINRNVCHPVYDKIFDVQAQAEGSVRPTYREIQIFHKINKEFTYPQNTTNNNDFPLKGNYFFLTVSDSTAVSHPSMRGRVDLCFKNVGN